MLKTLETQTASAVLHRSRISLASPKMSTAATTTPPPPEARAQQKPQRPPAAYFPLGYNEAAYQWWTSVTPPLAERNVLALIPHLREAAALSGPGSGSGADALGSRVWRRSTVRLAGRNRALNEVCVERVGEPAANTLVMVHGYGAGLGFFYKNLEPISRIPGLRLYALDMLGMGNSSRPPFRIRAKDRLAQVLEAESWFVDALEEWRRERNIGHSLGGYLAVSYALKYPGHLNKLILASPVGIPEDPYAVGASMPGPAESTLQNEFSQDQQTVTETTAAASSASSSTSSAPGKTPPAAPPGASKRPLPGWLVWLWDANVSPFSIVRMAGPLGPRFVSGWSSRRFNHLPADEAQALHAYSFSIFKQKGSGEYALGYILAPGAYARRPIINRIHQVGRQTVAPAAPGGPAVKENGIPVVFMYGENDWMDMAGGLAAEEKLNEARVRALLHGSDDEKRNENGSARVVIIPKAGHHLYLDNPDDFNRVLREELEATMHDEGRKRAAP